MSCFQRQDYPWLAKDSIRNWYPSGTLLWVFTHAAIVGMSAFTSRKVASLRSKWKSEIRLTNAKCFIRSRWLLSALMPTGLPRFSIGKPTESGPCNHQANHGYNLNILICKTEFCNQLTQEDSEPFPRFLVSNYEILSNYEIWSHPNIEQSQKLKMF